MNNRTHYRNLAIAWVLAIMASLVGRNSSSADTSEAQGLGKAREGATTRNKKHQFKKQHAQADKSGKNAGEGEDAEPKLLVRVGRPRSEGRSIRAIAGEVGKSPNTILRLLRPVEVNA